MSSFLRALEADVEPARTDVARSERAAVATLALIAAVVPLIVNTRAYDYYYWPKAQALYAGIGILGILALGTARQRELCVPRSPIVAAVGCWVAALVVSTLLSVDPLVSLAGANYRDEGLLTWFSYGALVVSAAMASTTTRRVCIVAGAVVFAAGVNGIAGILQHFGWSPVPQDLVRDAFQKATTRAWGTAGSPIALSACLVLVLPLVISLYTWEGRPLRRIAYGAASVLLYAALVATWTRAAWGALVVGLGVWAFAAGRRRLQAALRPLLVLGLLLAAVTPAILLTGPPRERLEREHIANRGENGGDRLFLWRTTAPLIFKRPLFGWGPETLGEIYPAYETPEFRRVFPASSIMKIIVDRPHNDLLQQGISTGLVGLAAYVAVWVVVFRSAWAASGADRRGAAGPGGLATGLLGGFAAYCFQLQLAFSYVSVAPLFWMLVGLLLALERMQGLRPGRRNTGEGTKEMAP